MSMLLLLQFSKQATYLHCKAINLLGNQQCDCEANFAVSFSSEDSSPFSSISTVGVLDEFFTPTTHCLYQPEKFEDKYKPAGFRITNYRYSHTDNLYRPPQG